MILNHYCMKNDLPMIKWLISYGKRTGHPVNIRNSNDFMFKYSCSNSHVKIAKYLFSQCNAYKKFRVSKNGEIKYVIQK